MVKELFAARWMIPSSPGKRRYVLSWDLGYLADEFDSGV
jgi:hypothetical protein